MRFVDHIINHLTTYGNDKLTETNSRTVYTLLTKILAKQGFLTLKERSFAYQSLVEVIIKCPELLDFGKKDPLELVDDTFNEFAECSSARSGKDQHASAKDDEVYANWIKCLSRLKQLF